MASTCPNPHPWDRYVALGDSFSEGIGDPNPESVGAWEAIAAGPIA